MEGRNETCWREPDRQPTALSEESTPPAVGSRVAWSTLGGGRYEGVVVEIDNGDMVVRCDDGVTRVTPWEE